MFNSNWHRVMDPLDSRLAANLRHFEDNRLIQAQRCWVSPTGRAHDYDRQMLDAGLALSLGKPSKSRLGSVMAAALLGNTSPE